MKFYKYFSFTLVIILVNISLSTFPQELATLSKKAKKAFENAERSYRMQEYTKALVGFKDAINHDPNFFEAWIMLGEVYQEMHLDSNSVDAYRKAVSINDRAYPSAFFILANIEIKNGWYKEAQEHYTIYLNFKNISLKNKKKSEKNLRNCEFALDAIQHPVPFKPVNLGSAVNSELNEYFPCLTADNKNLLFTRLLKDKNSFTGRQEDFYVSVNKDGNWEQAKNVGLPINTYYNEGAPTLSADGITLIFTACESVNGYGAGRKGFGRCDLFISQLNGLKWTTPENVGTPVNSGNWESQPCLSADGRSLYFVSNRNNDYDIWVTTKDENGDWQLPEMLNGNINTSGYEGSVFLHPDNQTLYFSSDGHTGMGGMDIFYSRRDSTGDWGVPVNLGYPINTHKDENSILIGADGELAMFASDRETGYGGLDLYQFELYEEARPQYVTYMKGKVFDSESSSKLKASFELTDLETGDVVYRSYSNAGTGEFLVCLPTNRDYALNVSKQGYLFFSENFSLSGISSNTDPFIKDIPLKKI